jgi:hypothetical protein
MREELDQQGSRTRFGFALVLAALDASPDHWISCCLGGHIFSVVDVGDVVLVVDLA